MTDDTKRELDAIPDSVFVSWLSNILSDEFCMSSSTFMLAMTFRTLETMDLWEYVAQRFTARLQWIVANRNPELKKAR